MNEENTNACVSPSEVEMQCGNAITSRRHPCSDAIDQESKAWLALVHMLKF